MILTEQDLSRFLGYRRRGIDAGTNFVSANNGRPSFDSFEPAFQVRKTYKPKLQIRVFEYPGITGHVGNGVIAGDKLTV